MRKGRWAKRSRAKEQGHQPPLVTTRIELPARRPVCGGTSRLSRSVASSPAILLAFSALWESSVLYRSEDESHFSTEVYLKRLSVTFEQLRTVC